MADLVKTVFSRWPNGLNPRWVTKYAWGRVLEVHVESREPAWTSTNPPGMTPDHPDWVQITGVLVEYTPNRPAGNSPENPRYYVRTTDGPKEAPISGQHFWKVDSPRLVHAVDSMNNGASRTSYTDRRGYTHWVEIIYTPVSSWEGPILAGVSGRSFTITSRSWPSDTSRMRAKLDTYNFETFTHSTHYAEVPATPAYDANGDPIPQVTYFSNFRIPFDYSVGLNQAYLQWQDKSVEYQVLEWKRTYNVDTGQWFWEDDTWVTVVPAFGEDPAFYWYDEGICSLSASRLDVAPPPPTHTGPLPPPAHTGIGEVDRIHGGLFVERPRP